MNVGSNKHIMQNYEDLKADLHVHIYINVLPKIDVKRVQAIQNLIYTSVRNKLINMLKALDSRTKIKYDYNSYELDDNELIHEVEPSKEDIIKVIDNRIKELKRQQKTVNCVAYTYLE